MHDLSRLSFINVTMPDAALTKALPRLLREVRDVVGERRVTIVFDRGGWSPKLFSTMITDGFDLLTYRKGRCRRIKSGGSSGVAPSSTGAGWTIFSTTSPCASSKASCAYCK